MPTQITPLPTPPSRQDPASFSNRADAFLGQLPTFATEVNQLAIEAEQDAVTATTQAGIATTQASNASTSATTSSNWAIKVDGYVTGTNNSSKSWAVGGTGTGQPSLGDAKSWATRTGTTVDGTDYSSKEYATGNTVPTGSAKEWAISATSPDGTAEQSAKTYATQAATSASNAAVSETNAENSAVQASKLNLGPKATAPTADNQGQPLLQGATYYDTALNKWRVWNGTYWVEGISTVAGVSSFNGLTGDIIYQVPQLTKPVNTSPANSTTNVKPGDIISAEKSKSIYGTTVETKFQISTSTDFTTGVVETAWLTSGTDTVSYTLTSDDITEGNTTHYWRAVCRTVVDSDTFTSEPSTAFNFSTKAFFFFDYAPDVDGLTSLVTIQTEYNPATTYNTGQIVTVRKNARSFKEYKSLQNSNTGNSPATSPAFWELVYDNNLGTSGYFGEVLGNKCVVDKGEWISTTAYSIGDMVVVRNIPTPLKQSDLTAYVAKTANTNKPPASNPAFWEQRNALPTGTSLAQILGIANVTPEVLINNASGWLKFIHRGEIKYIAKKPFMHTVSWDDIAKAEAVYGNRTVRIGSRLYRVSLLSGAEADPSSWTTSSTATDNKGAGSEWNELVYRVHNVVPTDGTTTYHGGKQVGSNWWNFTDADTVMTSAAGNGSYTWCKETLSFNTASRVIRGNASLSGFNRYTSSDTTTGGGWRPCLTLISEPEADSSLYNAEATGVGPSVASLQYDPITDTGYYGQVTSAQFYTGTQISTATAVTSGTLQNDTEGWLKFYWHGQVLFIAKKTYRHSISWDNINTANAVYGVNLGSTGKKTITHSGSSTSYDVKLMKGATKDPSPASSPGSQWDELLYRVCTGTETGEIGANWATLNPSTDLGINSGNGSYSWTQEVYQPSTASRVRRGYGSLSGFGSYTSSLASTGYGWRPCLALAR